MRYFRSGKIVATIGPATCEFEKLESLFLRGVDVFRLNFSHGNHEGHKKVYDDIRKIGEKFEYNPAILADLQGPKLRVGVFENDRIILESGSAFRLDLDQTPGNERRVNLPHPEILEALQVGSTLLLDDGKLRFEITSCSPTSADVKVIVGGVLSNRKGVNVPDVVLKIPILTEKDKADLDFALNLGVDWVAVSFVQTVEDMIDAKRVIDGRAGAVAKLEKPMAIQAMAPIIEVSDAVMIARGDLGVEMRPEELPPIQRQIISTCHRMGRPVIVATQMLESMIDCPTPTRAEISDIATAVYSGADATMLSAETASGKYPFEAVKIMSKTISHIEADPQCLRRLEDDATLPQCSVIDAISAAAKSAAEHSCAKAIVLFTDSFETVVRCSRLRPKAPIILVCDSKKLASKAGLCHAVFSVVVKKEFDVGAMTKLSKKIAKDNKFADTGDVVVVMNDITGNTVEVCKL